MNKVTSTDIKRAALIAGVGVAAWVVEGLGERSDIPVAIFLGGFVGWMVFQVVRSRKQPPDALRVRYGRLALAGLATMLVIRTIAERVVSSGVARGVGMAFLAVWVIVVDFLYRKGREKR